MYVYVQTRLQHLVSCNIQQEILAHSMYPLSGPPWPEKDKRELCQDQDSANSNKQTESEGGRNTVRYRGHSRDKIALSQLNTKLNSSITKCAFCTHLTIREGQLQSPPLNTVIHHPPSAGSLFPSGPQVPGVR